MKHSKLYIQNMIYFLSRQHFKEILEFLEMQLFNTQKIIFGLYELPLIGQLWNHSIIFEYFSWNLRVADGLASSVRATINQLPSWDMAAKRERQINRSKQKEVWSGVVEWEGGSGNGTTTCGATLISLPEKWHARWTHNYGRNKVICRNCNWAEGRQLRRPFAK